ncbi:MAG TPA: SprT family zinc-dependent metalloprotease [Chitinophagaceae bacterium]|jgi:predicted metal-dependent hydrolase|nr:SprT family zinc-dependent metalloprotease [Saprospiraceae bacterium]HMT74360.1 SprT family zinc-dependent metalloprotease [Chitinophagaceae bacterium]
MTSYIQFGSKRIDFKLEYSDRKSLGITVTPDPFVVVKAPAGSSLDQVKNKLQNKAPWIIKQRNYFLSFHPKTPPRKYVSGETHLYLGRQYRLRVVKGSSDEVKLKGKFIEVVTTNKYPVKTLLNSWYLNHAKDKFTIIALPLIERFKKYKVEPTCIQIREMSARWGSCTPKGKIILNPDLIRAPKACIEYVVVHELCHLVYHEHSQRFIDLQTREMKDWEKWKQKLEKLLA